MKFGTVKGVFIPSTEAILGTVLFLLMPTLMADVGLITMLIILLLAHSVTIATAFSLSDCATNINRIEGGGMYALSKLSLGKAMGGSIGIMLYFAQAASIGFYCVGFAAAMLGVLKPFLHFIPIFTLSDPTSLLLQQQIIATFFLMVFFIIVMAGADFTLKIQSLIMVILMLSVAAIFFSPLSGIEFEGSALFLPNLNMQGSRPITVAVFFMAFTQFFPAVTGISTGIGMSGDLKDPRKSIVRGTFGAILFTMVIYFLISFIYASMNPDSILTGYNNGIAQGVILTELLGINRPFPENIFGILVFTGVIFATGSSALSVFMTGPRTAQYLAKDNILPKGLFFLSKDFNAKGSEPRYAILVSLALGLLIIWMGDISFAAMVVGILFLVVYGWVNGAAFLERISKNPSFRPTFKNHWLISLYGFLACIFAICLFNWWIGLGVFLSQFVLFRLIQYYKTSGKLEGVWWGVLYSTIAASMRRLQKIVQGSRNWRPVLTSVVFASEQQGWKPLGELSNQIASYSGLVSRYVLWDSKNFPEEMIPKADFNPVFCGTISNSLDVILQTCQHGGILSNTLLLEYHSKVDNAKILRRALDLNKNILLYKSGNPMEDSQIVNRLDIWWRGERNGNLMALLAFIINRSRSEKKEDPYSIRIIRKMGPNEDAKSAEGELKELFALARIQGEILILPHDEMVFLDQVKSISSKSSLIMMGLPGNYTEKVGKGLFRLNEFFFSKEISRYDSLPPLLFIRSNEAFNLTED